jgi:apolipoprotein N-acyltransferase
MEKYQRSFSDVMHDILHNLQDIMRSEIRLAKAEVREETQKFQVAGALLAAGSLFGVFALFFLLLTAAEALATVVPGWQATLIVAVCLLAISGMFAAFGARLVKRMRAPPARTVDNIRETVRWAKTQLK